MPGQPEGAASVGHRHQDCQERSPPVRKPPAGNNDEDTVSDDDEDDFNDDNVSDCGGDCPC